MFQNWVAPQNDIFQDFKLDNWTNWIGLSMSQQFCRLQPFTCASFQISSYNLIFSYASCSTAEFHGYCHRFFLLLFFFELLFSLSFFLDLISIVLQSSPNIICCKNLMTHPSKEQVDKILIHNWVNAICIYNLRCITKFVGFQVKNMYLTFYFFLFSFSTLCPLLCCHWHWQ